MRRVIYCGVYWLQNASAILFAEQNRFNHQTEIKWLQKWCYRQYRYTNKNEANISSFCEIKYVHCFEVTLIMTENTLFSEMVLCGQNDTFLTISLSNLHCLKRTIFPKNHNKQHRGLLWSFSVIFCNTCTFVTDERVGTILSSWVPL